MHPPRFYAPEIAPGRVTLDPSESAHADRSLRLRAGDAVCLIDGRGGLGEGIVADDDARTPGDRPRVTRGRPALSVLVRRVVRAPAPSATLALVVAGCKGPRLTWLVEKCTELGVGELVLARFERSVVRVGAAHLTRLRRTAIEACKQCGRTWFPELRADEPVARVLSDLRADLLLVAHPAADAQPLERSLTREIVARGRIAAVVGPEGGLSPAELALLTAAGGRPVRIAEHVLRVETAALALAADWAALRACDAPPAG